MSKPKPEEGQRVPYMSPDGGRWEARIEKVHADSERSEVNLRYGDRAQLAENVPYSQRPARGCWGREENWRGQKAATEPKVEVA